MATKQVFQVGDTKVKATDLAAAQRVAQTTPGSSIFQAAQTTSSTPVPTPPKVDTTQPFDAAKLPTSSITYPPAVNDKTATTGLSAAMTAFPDQLQAAQKEAATQEATTPPANNKLNDALSKILGLSNQMGEQGKRTLEIQEEEGVFAKKKATKDLENQILSKSRAYDKQIQAAQKNAKGMLEGGVDIETQRIGQQKNSELADLAIQYKVANDDYVGAFEIAKAKVDAEFEPLKNQLETLKTYYQLAQNDMTESEKLKAQEVIREKEATIAFERDKELYKYKQQIDQSDPLYRANLAKAQNEATQSLATSNSVDVNSLVANGTAAPEANSAALTALLKNNKIGQGTRTQIANILGVVNATQDLANKRLDGKFGGLNPLTGLLNTKILGVGLPFRENVKGQTQIENEGYIEAINLKVQQWASGASLTDQQTQQVNRLTPRTSDTDAAVRTKLNNLNNFMMTQAQSQLQSEGVTLVPAKVNLFETMDLLDEATPEQLQALRDQGLIQ